MFNSLKLFTNQYKPFFFIVKINLVVKNSDLINIIGFTKNRKYLKPIKNLLKPKLLYNS